MLEQDPIHKKIGVMAVALLVLMAGPAIWGCSEDDSGSPGNGDQTGCSNSLEQQVMDLINQERGVAKMPELTVDTRLVVAADRHATDMALIGFMNHTGSDGSTPVTRVTDAGYPFTSVSENIAMGDHTLDSAAEVVAGWMSSDGHRAHILSATAQHLGVAHAVSGIGTQMHYWCVDFGASSDAGQVPEDGCHP